MLFILDTPNVSCVITKQQQNLKNKNEYMYPDKYSYNFNMHSIKFITVMKPCIVLLNILKVFYCKKISTKITVI